MASKGKKVKKEKKLYVVTDYISGRVWAVIAKSHEDAEKRVEEEFVDYFPDNEFSFETEESDNGGVQIGVKYEAL